MKEYTVYIIQSQKIGLYYIGVTSDLMKRLRYHNAGANRSTKNKGPWFIVYTEQFLYSSDAWKRERQIKKYKGGVAFKKLIADVHRTKSGEIA